MDKKEKDISTNVKTVKDLKMPKKETQVITTIPEQEAHKLLLQLHEKMETNSLMNGGFDVLMEKVKNIEEDISELRESVYDQNDGIFTKVKNVETQNNINNVEVKNKIHIFEEILQKHEKKIEDNSKTTNEYMEKLNESIKKIELQLKEIDIWKKISIAVGGFLLGLILEYLGKLLL